MYFNKKNDFYHGIMFHHFHDDGFHTKSQGSINRDQFYKIINFIGRKNILNADIFLEKLKNNKLKKTEVCLTFDDSLKCQVDIALPVLEDLKIKSFFFVHTSIFENKIDNLELFRYFRTNYFNCVEKFYKKFYEILDKDIQFFFSKSSYIIQEWKIKFPFYSIEDIKFRLVRDLFLTNNQYEKIMYRMFKEKKFDYKNFIKKFYFQKKDLLMLYKLNHIIGLHSHDHPTMLNKQSYDEQKKQYEKNQFFLSDILTISKDKIKCMSHPNGSYNDDTLKILNEMKMELGFKQTMISEKKINNSF